MAILLADARCAICEEPLSRPFTTTSGYVFAPEHRLFRFCDAPLHLSCLEVWPDREEFARAYYDDDLDRYRRGSGTLIHIGETWLIGCGPSEPPAVPYFAEVRLRDWPIRLYTLFEEWDAFVGESYRKDLVGAALSRADAVMTEVRRMLPDQRALQEAWKVRQVGSLISRAASKAERHTHVNISVIGMPTDGAAELAAALFRLASGRDPVDADFVDGDEIRYLEYRTHRVHYAHVLLPSAPGDFSRYYQALQGVDAIVLAVDLSVGLCRATLEECLWASAAGVPQVIVCAGSSDVKRPNAEGNVRASLYSCGFRYENLRWVGLTGRRPAGREMHLQAAAPILRVMDKILQPRAKHPQAPFVLPVGDVFQISGRGTIVVGRVESGQLRAGTDLSLLGGGREKSVRATNIEMFRRQLDLAVEGDHVGITIAGASRPDVERGMVLATPNSLRQSSAFRAEVNAPECLGGSQGGSPPSGDYALFMQTMALPAKVKRVRENLVEVQVESSLPWLPGWRCMLRSQGKTVGMGSIKE